MEVLDYRKAAKQLRTPNRELTEADLQDPTFLASCKEMEQVLKRDGVGLAAPQVGWNVKLFLLCIDEQIKDIEPQLFINPRIIKLSKETNKFEEGCLSFPDLFLDIRRSASITWTYRDANWTLHQKESSGFYARAVLHEVDHCEGRVFIDAATSVQKLKVNRWLKS